MKPDKLSKEDKETLNLVTLAQKYADADTARELFEAMRWPNGACCPRCQNDGKSGKAISKIVGKAKSESPARKGLYFCGACRKQFTATVGTIFEGSHIPLSKWLMALFIVCSSKKAVSAHQLHRMLGLTYKSAWFMAHRIRFALGSKPEKLSGTVEVDETYIGGKGGDKRKLYYGKTPVVALIERDGKMQARVVPTVTEKNLGKCLNETVDKTAVLNTDDHAGYRRQGKKFQRHDVVVHSKYEYARPNADGSKAHVNSCESFFALLKRGVHGAWHCVSPEHLPKYANEFAFRWNHRKMTDGERMCAAIPFTEGVRMFYRQPAD